MYLFINARDYFSYKKELIPNVMEAYRTLAEEYDVIVIGGGVAGVAAAVSAARNGAKTLLKA